MPYLESASGALYYETIDAVPPWVAAPQTLLFCHGVATNADIWSSWLPSLIDRYRILRFDTRGFGRSADQRADTAWSMDLLADDILAVAVAAGVRRFHLIGESMGGTVALHLATRRPEQVLSVTVASTSHKGGAIQRANAWRAFIEAHGMEAWSRDMMERRFQPRAVSGAVHDWFHAVQTATRPDMLLACTDMLLGADLTEAVSRITVPTLILAPDSSPFVPLEVPLDLRRRVPKAELQTFAGVRHGLACSHGGDCATVLRAFLERHGMA
jgi:pimeloyl-ACP methyl ester carboxylesterase